MVFALDPSNSVKKELCTYTSVVICLIVENNVKPCINICQTSLQLISFFFFFFLFFLKKIWFNISWQLSRRTIHTIYQTFFFFFFFFRNLILSENNKDLSFQF